MAQPQIISLGSINVDAQIRTDRWPDAGETLRGGCVVIHEHGMSAIGGVEMDVVDTTGAGDAFAGALGVALLEGKNPLEAARFAVAASHLAVTRYGSQEAYPTRQELEALRERLPVDRR